MKPRQVLHEKLFGFPFQPSRFQLANDCFRRLRFDVAVERIDNHLKEMWGKKAKTVGLSCLWSVL